MNKKEAAKQLDISEKTIERAVNNGLLVARYVPSKHGKMLEIEQADLDRFKQEREAVILAPALVHDDQPAALAPAESLLPTTIDQSRDNDRQADFTTALADALAFALDRRAAPVLTVKEAAQAFNVSQSAIKAAIKTSWLKSYKIGVRGASVIKRDDLERWIAEL